MIAVILRTTALDSSVQIHTVVGVKLPVPGQKRLFEISPTQQDVTGLQTIHLDCEGMGEADVADIGGLMDGGHVQRLVDKILYEYQRAIQLNTYMVM